MERKVQIIYQDSNYIVVNKPSHLLVHRTNLDFYERDSLRDRLISDLGYLVNPVNRLDKPTSGLVLFSKNKEAHQCLSEQFRDHTISKKYIAIVRGYTPSEGEIDKPLENGRNNTLTEAVTNYKTLCNIELDIPVSRYETSRYSLVKVAPITGVYHQIRRHFNHLRHPILGDKRHGDRHHNKSLVDKFQNTTMFLHSQMLTIKDPSGNHKEFTATIPDTWEPLYGLFPNG